MKLDLKTPFGCLIWILPSPFCSARFINDKSYTKTEAYRPTAQKLAANPMAYRRPSVSFENKSITVSKEEKIVMDFDNFAYVTRHNLVEITTTCNIKAREEEFVDYGKSYSGFFGEL